MDIASNPSSSVMDEHRVLVRHYGRTQLRCSELIERQAAEISVLQAQAIRLRGALVVRETALSWAREARPTLEAEIPSPRSRVVLLRRIDWLVERIQELMRERLHWQWRRDQDLPIASSNTEDGVIVAGTTVSAEPLGTAECTVDDVEAFEASLVTADLVICQTGCLSHDAYWRVQDHCRRTGKACVVMARPDVLRIVLVHASDPAEAPNDR